MIGKQKGKKMTYPNFELIGDIIQRRINNSCISPLAINIDSVINDLKYKTLNPLYKKNEQLSIFKLKCYGMAIGYREIEFYRYIAKALSAWEKINDISKF